MKTPDPRRRNKPAGTRSRNCVRVSGAVSPPRLRAPASFPRVLGKLRDVAERTRTDRQDNHFPCGVAHGALPAAAQDRIALNRNHRRAGQYPRIGVAQPQQHVPAMGSITRRSPDVPRTAPRLHQGGCDFSRRADCFNKVVGATSTRRFCRDYSGLSSCYCPK